MAPQSSRILFRRRRLLPGLLAGIATMLVLPTIGCAGNNSPHIAAGTYTLSVTASPGNSSVASQTVSMVVNIQK